VSVFKPEPNRSLTAAQWIKQNNYNIQRLPRRSFKVLVLRRQRSLHGLAVECYPTFLLKIDVQSRWFVTKWRPISLTCHKFAGLVDRSKSNT